MDTMYSVHSEKNNPRIIRIDESIVFRRLIFRLQKVKGGMYTACPACMKDYKIL